MILKLDHLAVSASSRDAARAHIEEALGVKMQDGGTHVRFGTHNHLMGLGGALYLEAISIDPEAPPPDRPRWFDLDNFSGAPRLTNWICAVDDLDEALAQWPNAGAPVDLERGDLRWRMAVPRDGKLPFDGLFPPLICWQGSLHPAQMLAPTGVSLEMLTVMHPRADDLSTLLGDVVGASVCFECCEAPALVAEFDTPDGIRVLQ